MGSDIEKLKREVDQIKRQVVNLQEEERKNEKRLVERYFIDGKWEEVIDSISEDAESAEIPYSPKRCGLESGNSHMNHTRVLGPEKEADPR